MERIGKIQRETKETKISLEICIEGKGNSVINTGVPFLDHMLILFAKHGLFDIAIEARGDLAVDIHHTNEDVGLCFGEALVKALGNKEGIRRFGFACVPMGEALVRVVLDISGRGSLSFDTAVNLSPPLEEDKYDWVSLQHFLQSFFWPTVALGITCALILLQPDLGGTIALASVGVLLLFVAGIPIVHIVGLSLLSLPVLHFAIFNVPYGFT